jgi:hypothetical protein
MNDFEYFSMVENVRKKTKPIATMLWLALLLYCTICNYPHWMFFWAVLFIGEVIPSDIYPVKTFYAIRDELKKERNHGNVS